jgi:hypothetical protein
METVRIKMCRIEKVTLPVRRMSMKLMLGQR